MGYIIWMCPIKCICKTRISLNRPGVALLCPQTRNNSKSNAHVTLFLIQTHTNTNTHTYTIRLSTHSHCNSFTLPSKTIMADKHIYILEYNILVYAFDTKTIARLKVSHPPKIFSVDSFSGNQFELHLHVYLLLNI